VWLLAPISGLIILMYSVDIEYVLKAIRVTYFTGHKTAFLEDYKYFDNRTIQSGTAQPWNIHKDYNKIQATKKLEETTTELQTTAFLIIKDDSIRHERYFDGYRTHSQ